MKIHVGDGIKGSIEVDNLGIHQNGNKNPSDPLPWLKYAELCRILAGSEIFNKIDGEPLVSPKRTIFVVRQDFEFANHALAYIKHCMEHGNATLQKPVRFVHTTAEVGKTSAVYLCDVLDPNEGKVYMKMALRMVMVDRASRKPIAFSNRYREFVNERSTMKYTFADGPLRSVPTGTSVFSWKKVIGMHDVDYNGHTNNCAYTVMACECLGQAVDCAHPVQLPGEYGRCMIKRSSLVIGSESLLGQVVDVQMWQSDGDLFHFIMSVCGKSVAFLSMSYRCR